MVTHSALKYMGSNQVGVMVLCTLLLQMVYNLRPVCLIFLVQKYSVDNIFRKKYAHFSLVVCDPENGLKIFFGVWLI